MRKKKTRYYILDENNKPKSASQEEHLEWVKKNDHRFNRSKIFADGYKKASLSFIGKKEPDEQRIIFQFRSLWWSCGEIVDTPFSTQNFNSYRQALETYEMYLIMNGGYEE